MFRREREKGFTIPEVIVAGTIMIVLCVGTLSVFAYIVKINRGNALRMQALSVLQQKVEYYRSLKFVPDAAGRDANLLAIPNPHILSPITTPDGRTFTITAEVTNLSYLGAASEANCVYKSIRIVAVPTVAENEQWLQNLNTEVTIHRVRSN